jgi:hypothetical protein
MTTATIVIHACCERTRWPECITWSNYTLDELIRLAGFWVNASSRFSRGLSDNDFLVSGRAVFVRSLG